MMVMDDITEMKKHEEQLIRAKDFTFKLLDRFPTMVWRSDKDLNCDFTNHTLQEFTGLSLEETLGQGFRHAIHPEELDYVSDIVGTAIKNLEPFMLQHRLRRYDGEYLWVIGHEIPLIDENGNLIFVGSESSSKSKEELQPLINEIELLIEDLRNAILGNAYYAVEEITHNLKDLFGRIDAIELKDTAFKMELSVRKGKYNDLSEGVLQLTNIFNSLKKSYIL